MQDRDPAGEKIENRLAVPGSTANQFGQCKCKP